MRSPYTTVAIVGLGMMGGSLAMLIKSQYPDVQIVGVSRRKETAEYALAHHIVDEAYLKIDELPQSCDLAFICTPIDAVAPTFTSLGHHFKTGITITDIASVKEGLPLTNSALPAHHTYILGHPMAGIEKTGIEFADPKILAHARYLITCKGNQSCDEFKQFLNALSFETIVLPWGIHDSIVAAGSHIPYLMAILTSANATRQNLNHPVWPALGSGFRDTTRVAGSDPAWGTDICTYNATEILTQLKQIQDDLSQLIALITENDAGQIQNWLQNIRDRRQNLSQKSEL